MRAINRTSTKMDYGQNLLLSSYEILDPAMARALIDTIAAAESHLPEWTRTRIDASTDASVTSTYHFSVPASQVALVASTVRQINHAAQAQRPKP